MLPMKKMYCFLFIAAFCLCQAPLHAQLQKQREVTGFRHPESVCTDGLYFYVSNLGDSLLPNTKDGDGFISRVNAAGRLIDTFFISGLDAPKGMAVVNGILYVTDIDQVKGFSLQSRREVYRLDFAQEQTVFLNDLAVKNKHALFVSATDLGKVFELALAPRPAYQAVAVKDTISGANGLCYDAAAGILYEAGFGTSGLPNGNYAAISWKQGSPAYRKLNNLTGYYDGIALAGRNELLVSDWVNMEHLDRGELKQVNIQTGRSKTLLRGLQGAADFLYLPASKQLWMPETMGNKVTVWSGVVE
jgi:hypothetical protein